MAEVPAARADPSRQLPVGLELHCCDGDPVSLGETRFVCKANALDDGLDGGLCSGVFLLHRQGVRRTAALHGAVHSASVPL